MNGRALQQVARACLVAVAAHVAAGPVSKAAAAQVDTVVIRSDPSCATCSVGLEKVVSLGSPGDSSSVVPWSTVARNSRGEFYVAPMAHPGEIYVYGPDGRYHTKLGRAGQGPGEYGARLKVAIDDADSLHVIDDGNRRWTVLGPDYEVARSAPLPGFVRRFFVTASGRLVTHADVGTARCFGLPVQLLAADGTVERCFGGDDGVIRRDRPHSRMRQVADAGDGRIWSARVNRYEIELLDSLGHVRSRLVGSSRGREMRRVPSWRCPRGLGSSASPRRTVVICLLSSWFRMRTGRRLLAPRARCRSRPVSWSVSGIRSSRFWTRPPGSCWLHAASPRSCDPRRTDPWPIASPSWIRVTTGWTYGASSSTRDRNPTHSKEKRP